MLGLRSTVRRLGRQLLGGRTEPTPPRNVTPPRPPEPVSAANHSPTAPSPTKAEAPARPAGGFAAAARAAASSGISTATTFRANVDIDDHDAEAVASAAQAKPKAAKKPEATSSVNAAPNKAEPKSTAAATEPAEPKAESKPKATPSFNGTADPVIGSIVVDNIVRTSADGGRYWGPIDNRSARSKAAGERLDIDRNECIGCGTCVEHIDTVFYLNDEQGKAYVISQEGAMDRVEDAIDACPVTCISWQSGGSAE